MSGREHGTGDGQFNGVGGIAIDGDGNVDGNVDAAGTIWAISTDGGVTQIQRFDSSGKFLMGWGHRDNGETFGLNGVEHGLCVLPSGQVYVADSGNHRIRKFRLSHSAGTRSLGYE